MTSRVTSDFVEIEREPARGRARLVHRAMERLAARERDTLRRTLTPRDPASTCIDLASNDYLQLTRHPHLVEAVRRAATELGVGSASSRLVSGTTEAHGQLEARFASFKNAEAALVFPAGYMANLAVLTALTDSQDLIALDRLSHASLIDAARLARESNGASFRTYRHGDIEHLRERLSTHRASHPHAIAFIVTDSVFSMDGDIADIESLRACADEFDAVLVIDEAHGTGVLGPNGEGVDYQHRADITISTASKALGGLGGMVTADQPIIDALVNEARAFVYSTAVPPTQVAAINAALDVVRDEPERRERLCKVVMHLRTQLQGVGVNVGDDPTPIIPIVVGDADTALALSQKLLDAGFIAPAIRPPTVPKGKSRVRLSLHCDVSIEDVDRLVDVIAKL